MAGFKNLFQATSVAATMFSTLSAMAAEQEQAGSIINQRDIIFSCDAKNSGRSAEVFHHTFNLGNQIVNQYQFTISDGDRDSIASVTMNEEAITTYQSMAQEFCATGMQPDYQELGDIGDGKGFCMIDDIMITSWGDGLYTENELNEQGHLAKEIGRVEFGSPHAAWSVLAQTCTPFIGM